MDAEGVDEDTDDEDDDNDDDDEDDDEEYDTDDEDDDEAVMAAAVAHRKSTVRQGCFHRYQYASSYDLLGFIFSMCLLQCSVSSSMPSSRYAALVSAGRD